MSILDTPVRHEFYDADDPQYPIHLPSTYPVEVVKTEAQIRWAGLQTEAIVFKHYVKL